MKSTVIQRIAETVDAFHTCEKNDNEEWRERHFETLQELEREALPRGSGIDNGVRIDIQASTMDFVTLRTSFHHMNEHGYYVGWSEHTIVVTPAFRGVNLRITGRNRNEIKDYLHEVFEHALTREIED